MSLHLSDAELLELPAAIRAADRNGTLGKIADLIERAIERHDPEVIEFTTRYFTDDLFRRRIDRALKRDPSCLMNPALRARLLRGAS